MSCLCKWFGISNTCGGLWSNGVGQNRAIDKEHNKDYAEEGFSCLTYKLTEMVREAAKLQVRGMVVSIFEMDQNWN